MLAFASRTGNVRAIVQRLNYPNIEITEELQLEQPFVLVTYTDGLGAVPQQVAQFMGSNFTNCMGIIASGNRNFGENFAKAADLLAKQYELPIIAKLDLRGQQSDFQQIENFLHQK